MMDYRFGGCVDTQRGFYGFTNDLDGIELDRVERAHSGAWRAPQVALEFRKP